MNCPPFYAAVMTDRVAVYWTTPESAPWFDTVLNDAEHARLSGFQYAPARRSFVAGRALLRIVAGARLGVPPWRVRIDSTCARCGDQHGRPRLVDASDVDLSVAHCAGRVVVAVADRTRVGVDVEPRTAAAFDGFDDVALSARERAHIGSLPIRDRVAIRTRMWVHKEAALKASGQGLTRSPDSLEWDDPATQFHEIDVGAAYCAVVAAPPPGHRGGRGYRCRFAGGSCGSCDSSTVLTHWVTSAAASSP